MNINITKTKEVYGYDISTTQIPVSRPVIWFCSNCSVEKPIRYGFAIKQKLCRACNNKTISLASAKQRSESLKKWHLVNEHPLKGTKRPAHVIEALRKSATGRIKSKEELVYRSELMRGEKNPFYGKTHSQEVRDKISANNKLKGKKGKECNFYGRIYHSKRKNNPYTDVKGIEYQMRSSWEVKVAAYFDFNSVLWEYEPKAFPVVMNNKHYSYTPDFLLVDTNTFIEVKGYWRDDASLKFNIFKETYPNIKIEIWDKAVLKKLNIKL